MRQLPALLVVVSLLSSFFSAPLEAQSFAKHAPSPSVSRALQDALGVSTFELYTLHLPAQAEDDLHVTLPLEGGVASLDLERHSLRASSFQVLVDSGDGNLSSHPAPPVSTYRGSVLGVPEAEVAATFDGNEFQAWVRTPSASWVLESVPAKLGLGDDFYALYRSEDQPPAPGLCGAGALEGSLQFSPPREGASSGSNAVCEIAFDTDHEFFVLNGSSVSATVADIEQVMNGVDLIFREDTDIRYEITAIIVRETASDPYSSSDSYVMLSEFRNHWNSEQGAISRDIAHLMTGKNVDGSIIGLAWVGVICHSSYGYGLSQSRFSGVQTYRVGLTAHELGHNWSSGHCSGSDCRIMCPYIGGCDGDLTRFGAGQISTITSYRDSRDCLDDPSPPAPFPFAEPFSSLALDDSHWSSSQGLSLTDAASGEPSAPYAASLDGNDAELRSQRFELGSVPGAELGFFFQPSGTEVGDDLVVEYLDDQENWVELGRIVADGSSPLTFDVQVFELPAGALHDSCCIRFRSDANASGDIWYLDDIVLEIPEVDGVDRYGQSTAGTQGIVPQINTSGGLPTLGNASFQLEASQFYGGQLGFLFIGFTRQTLDMGQGTYLNVLPPWQVLSVLFSGASAPGSGSSVVPFPLPNEPLLDGFHIMCMFMGIDFGAPLGLSGSEGLDITLTQ